MKRGERVEIYLLSFGSYLKWPFDFFFVESTKPTRWRMMKFEAYADDLISAWLPGPKSLPSTKETKAYNQFSITSCNLIRHSIVRHSLANKEEYCKVCRQRIDSLTGDGFSPTLALITFLIPSGKNPSYLLKVMPFRSEFSDI